MDKTCGSKLPNDVTASGNLMLVEFVTDGAGTASGFEAIFTSGRSENKESEKKKKHLCQWTFLFTEEKHCLRNCSLQKPLLSTLPLI